MTYYLWKSRHRFVIAPEGFPVVRLRGFRRDDEGEEVGECQASSWLEAKRKLWGQLTPLQNELLELRGAA